MQYNKCECGQTIRRTSTKCGMCAHEKVAPTFAETFSRFKKEGLISMNEKPAVYSAFWNLAKTVALLALIALAPAAYSQTAASPFPVDFRHTLQWDDPNDPGFVGLFKVYVGTTNRTNTVSPFVAMDTLMLGMPKGTYALSAVAVSTNGTESVQSTNIFVTWPGGNGRPHAPANLRIFK
jgi:hypothetical protein